MTAGRLDSGSDEIVRHAEIPFPGLRMSRCRPNGVACSRPIPVLSASAGDRICRWTVRVASRVDAMVIEPPSRREASGHRRRCPVGRRCNGGADRWRGFSRPRSVRKGLRHSWLRLRHPQSRADLLDAGLMRIRRRLAQLTPPSYIVASTGWVPPVTVSSPSRRGSLHAAQTVNG